MIVCGQLPEDLAGDFLASICAFLIQAVNTVVHARDDQCRRELTLWFVARHRFERDGSDRCCMRVDLRVRERAFAPEQVDLTGAVQRQPNATRSAPSEIP
jgi:hypothetical protein